MNQSQIWVSFENAGKTYMVGTAPEYAKELEPEFTKGYSVRLANSLKSEVFLDPCTPTVELMDNFSGSVIIGGEEFSLREIKVALGLPVEPLLRDFHINYSVSDCEHSPEWHSCHVQAFDRKQSLEEFLKMNLYHIEVQIIPL